MTKQADPSFDCSHAVEQAREAKVSGFLSNKTSQFTYFALQLGDWNWNGKKVLDFGGNVGSILKDPNSTIDAKRYWCIDVVKDAIEKGKRSYPDSHWIFYNRYSFFFNPLGIPHLTLPDPGQRFNYIVAYSVFTNTTRSDMLQLVSELETMLAKDGVLAFTFIDPNHFSWPKQYPGNNLEWRLEREIQLEREKGNALPIKPKDVMNRARDAGWFTLVNGEDLYLETEDIGPYEAERQKTWHAFYSEKYMKELFPQATVLPPVNNEMQHCCVIRRS